MVIVLFDKVGLNLHIYMPKNKRIAYVPYKYYQDDPRDKSFAGSRYVIEGVPSGPMEFRVDGEEVWTVQIP